MVNTADVPENWGFFFGLLVKPVLMYNLTKSSTPVSLTILKLYPSYNVTFYQNIMNLLSI